MERLPYYQLLHILSLIVLTAHTFMAFGWVIVKLVCWLGLASLAGIVYRKAHLRGLLSYIALACIAVAVTMVYFRPGF
jgi:hypothetical protein